MGWAKRMANKEHLKILWQGVEAWNRWRSEHPDVEPELSEANLHGRDLSGRCAPGGLGIGGLPYLTVPEFLRCNLSRADLSGANLFATDLSHADLCGANLQGAKLQRTNLNDADLTGADLTGADLWKAILVDTNLSGVTLVSCRVYGVSAWDVNLKGIRQTDLIITPHDQPEITVDNLEMAQFVYLLLYNEKIRDVIDTITSKVVLILGRFTPERKVVLDALREELRKHNRTPIVFYFDPTASKNVTDTVKLLAQMTRYVIVDLSDPNSAPYELGVISMLGLDSTPVVPIIASGQRPFSMLEDVLRKPWSTKLIEYRDLDDLRANLDGMLVEIAEAKVQELRGGK